MKTYRKNIPDGMRDMVYGEIKTAKELGDKLLKLYQKRGYAEVVTPTIEYFDVFNIENRVIAEESMFKMTDKSGKLVVLRPDNTTPMARMSTEYFTDIREREANLHKQVLKFWEQTH